MSSSAHGPMATPGPAPGWGPGWAKVLAGLSLVFPLLLAIYGLISIATSSIELIREQPPGNIYTGLGLLIGTPALIVAAVMALPGVWFLGKRGAVSFVFAMVVLAISVRIAGAIWLPQHF